jgi:hypothetical protein
MTETTLAAIEDAADQPTARVLALARAFRAFAHANPMTYLLATSSTTPELRLDPAVLESLALLLQRVIATIAADEHSLAALRGMWALIHGFAMLELNEQFQRGGDLDATFDQAVEAYIAGWMARGSQ